MLPQFSYGPKQPITAATASAKGKPEAAEAEATPAE